MSGLLLNFTLLKCGVENTKYQIILTLAFKNK